MGLDRYRALIDEIGSYVTTVYLFLGGESLLHEDLVSMISIAHGRGIAVRLNTNATLLDRGKAVDLFEAKLDYISFSFDGYNAETYEKIRRGARFEPTLKNILEFLELKKERGTTIPYAVLETIVARQAQKPAAEELAFRNLFRDLPLDEFNLREFHSWRGLLKDEAELRLRDCNLGYTPCPYPWCALTVLWDGTIVPCCLDNWGEYTLGKVGERPLREVWNGDKMRALRRKLVSRRYEEISLCSDCDILWAENKTGKFPHTLLNVALSLPAANLLGYHLVNNLKRLLKGRRA